MTFRRLRPGHYASPNGDIRLLGSLKSRGREANTSYGGPWRVWDEKACRVVAECSNLDEARKKAMSLLEQP